MIVAQVCWRAEAQGKPAREAIMKHFGVSQATASRWRRYARELGYLEPHDPTRRAKAHPDPHYASVVMVLNAERQVFRKILSRPECYPDLIDEAQNEMFYRVLDSMVDDPQHPLHREARAFHVAIQNWAGDDDATDESEIVEHSGSGASIVSFAKMTFRIARNPAHPMHRQLATEAEAVLTAIEQWANGSILEEGVASYDHTAEQEVWSFATTLAWIAEDSTHPLHAPARQLMAALKPDARYW